MPKILLAEDDPTMITLLRTLLKMEGFEVFALDSNLDVVKAVNDSQPDLVLMDVHLFNQNGLDLLDTLRANPDTKSVRVVMTSGLNMKEECMHHGANAFILKPYMPDDLIKVLRSVLPA